MEKDFGPFTKFCIETIDDLKATLLKNANEPDEKVLKSKLKNLETKKKSKTVALKQLESEINSLTNNEISILKTQITSKENWLKDREKEQDRDYHADIVKIQSVLERLKEKKQSQAAQLDTSVVPIEQEVASVSTTKQSREIPKSIIIFIPPCCAEIEIFIVALENISHIEIGFQIHDEKVDIVIVADDIKSVRDLDVSDLPKIMKYFKSCGIVQNQIKFVSGSEVITSESLWSAE